MGREEATARRTDGWPRPPLICGRYPRRRHIRHRCYNRRCRHRRRYHYHRRRNSAGISARVGARVFAVGVLPSARQPPSGSSNACLLFPLLTLQCVLDGSAAAIRGIQLGSCGITSRGPLPSYQSVPKWPEKRGARVSRTHCIPRWSLPLPAGLPPPAPVHRGGHARDPSHRRASPCAPTAVSSVQRPDGRAQTSPPPWFASIRSPLPTSTLVAWVGTNNSTLPFIPISPPLGHGAQLQCVPLSRPPRVRPRIRSLPLCGPPLSWMRTTALPLPRPPQSRLPVVMHCGWRFFPQHRRSGAQASCRRACVLGSRPQSPQASRRCGCPHRQPTSTRPLQGTLIPRRPPPRLQPSER